MVADSLAPVSHLVIRLLLIISTVVAIGTDLLVDPYLRIRPGNLIALYPFDGNLDDQSPLATVEGQQRHAVGFNVTQTSSAHGGLYAYYFDTNGDWQELGKENERAPKKKPPKRVKVTRDEWVYGPNEKYQLEEGESELVTITRYVYKNAA